MYGILLTLSQNPSLLLEGAFNPIGLIIAIVVGLLIAFGAKAGMSNVQSGKNAAYYVRENSLNVMERRDSFLYSRTTSTEINDD